MIERLGRPVRADKISVRGWFWIIYFVVLLIALGLATHAIRAHWEL